MYERMESWLDSHINIIKLVLLVLCLGGIYILYSCIQLRINQQAGANDAGKQITEAGSNQQAITGGLREAENGATAITEQVDSIIRESNTTEEKLREAGAIISECQRIIKTVQARDAERAKKKQN